MEICRSIAGDTSDSDEDESEFEGFADEDLITLVQTVVESDLDTDSSDSHNDDGDNDDSDDENEQVPSTACQEWHSRLQNVTEETFCKRPGVHHTLEDDAPAVDYFQLFFTDEIFGKIVEATNLYATQVQAEKPDPKWRATTLEEMKMCVAINIMMGIHRLPRLENYWSTVDYDILNVPCISKLMSRSRYEKIGQYLHLNDKTNSAVWGKPDFDPLFKARLLINEMREKFSSLYIPEQAISIDEATIKFTGRRPVPFIRFKHTKLKQTRLGIKVWCSAEASSGYLLDFSIHTGKSQHLVEATDGLGQGAGVMTVGAKFLDKGYHFYFGNFFTSVGLAEQLLERKTRCCGIIRTNRKDWPHYLKVTKKNHLQPGEVRMLQRGDLVATVWQDKRTIAVLSTNVQPVMGSARQKTKTGGCMGKAIPQPILTYNEHMGGVDLHDQHRTYYPVGRSGQKWWHYIFWFCVQSSITNAWIIYKKTAQRTQKEKDPLAFRLALFEGLTKGNAHKKRQTQMKPSAAGRAISDPDQHPLVRLPGRKRCCVQCLKKGKRTEKGQGVETVFGCTTCNVNLCRGHCFAQFHEEIRH